MTTFVLSVDIGYRNFCLYIEEFDKEKLKELNDVSKKYEEDGTPTEEMKELLNKVFINGKTVLHKNLNLSINSTEFTDYLINMNSEFSSISEYLEKCDIVIIEKQMNRNIKALKLAQHCMSYFLIKYGICKTIIDFPSYHKTCVLGAPRSKGRVNKNGKMSWKTLDAKKRKKWSVEKSYDILKCRNEEEIIENIKSKRKKDDLADVITMCQAFKYLKFVKKEQI